MDFAPDTPKSRNKIWGKKFSSLKKARIIVNDEINQEIRGGEGQASTFYAIVETSHSGRVLKISKPSHVAMLGKFGLACPF